MEPKASNLLYRVVRTSLGCSMQKGDLNLQPTAGGAAIDAR